MSGLSRLRSPEFVRRRNESMQLRPCPCAGLSSYFVGATHLILKFSSQLDDEVQ